MKYFLKLTFTQLLMSLQSPYSPVPTEMLVSAKKPTWCSPINEEVQEVLYYS